MTAKSGIRTVAYNQICLTFLQKLCTADGGTVCDFDTDIRIGLITNDVDTLGQGLNQSVTQVITSTATLIGVVVMMLTISPLMTLIAFIILPVSAILMSTVVKFSQKYFRTQQEYLLPADNP